jgi:TolB protein
MTRALYRILFCAIAATSALGLCAQQTEVVLSATSGSKLVLAVAPPKLAGVDEATATQEFTGVLQRDLDETGVFGLLKDKLPGTTDPSSYKAWKEAGAQWLLVTKLTRAATGELQLDATAIDTGAEKAVFTKAYKAAHVFPLRRLAHLLSDDLVFQLTGVRGVASSRIVFVRQLSTGVKEIFQVDRDGANLLQLTRNRSLTLAPTVAADGRLAYLTYTGGAPEIWGQRTEGGAQVKLYAAPGGGMVSSPSWSPDGKRLAFVQGDRRGNTDIMVLDMATGHTRRLTDGSCINTEPSWNPDGTQLAFTSDREGGPQVYLMQSDGSNLRRLTNEGTYNASPAWSPNGAMVAYVSRFEGKFDLFIYKLGEGKAYQITTGVNTSESPAWSPDERRLVFTSNRFGSMQLFTTDLSGRQVVRLSDLANCQSPVWTRTR